MLICMTPPSSCTQAEFINQTVNIEYKVQWRKK